eukprot:scaffold213005_cov22-Prasinocladus_malaysianus.AAC.1
MQGGCIRNRVMAVHHKMHISTITVVSYCRSPVQGNEHRLVDEELGRKQGCECHRILPSSRLLSCRARWTLPSNSIIDCSTEHSSHL